MKMLNKKVFSLISLIAILLVSVIPLCSFTSGNLSSPTTYPQSINANMIRFNNGDIFAITMAGNNSSGSWDLTTTDLLYTVSSDNGSTWSDYQILVNHGSDWGLAGGASLVYNSSNNTLFLFHTHFKNFHDNKLFLQYTCDNGLTWSESVYINTGHEYEGLNANGIQLTDGTLVIPHNWDFNADLSTAYNPNYRTGLLYSTDGINWSQSNAVDISWSVCGADEMTICEWNTNGILGLVRTQTNWLYQVTTVDMGSTWDIKVLPFHAPDAPAYLFRNNGIIYGFWNNYLGRTGLSVMSTNDSLEWHDSLLLINGSYSAYPFVVKADDDTMLVTYWSFNSVAMNKFSSLLIRYDEVPATGNYTAQVYVPPPPPPVIEIPVPSGSVSVATVSDSGGLNFGGLLVNDYGMVLGDKTINSKQGELELSILAGVTALDKNGNPLHIIRINDTSENLSGFKVYDILPTNGTILPSAKLTFTYKPSDNVTPQIMFYDSGNWTPVISDVNVKHQTVSANITTLGKYALVLNEVEIVEHEITEPEQVESPVTSISNETKDYILGDDYIIVNIHSYGWFTWK